MILMVWILCYDAWFFEDTDFHWQVATDFSG